MSKQKIFISYCTKDNTKMELIKNLINANNKIEAIVVPQTDGGIMYSSEKITIHLESTIYFIPILTENSINNQWVNQEIGFAFGSSKIKNEKIRPIVQKSISKDLKGFISSSNNLDYRFENDLDFESVARNLVSKIIEETKNIGQY